MAPIPVYLPQYLSILKSAELSSTNRKKLSLESSSTLSSGFVTNGGNCHNRTASISLPVALDAQPSKSHQTGVQGFSAVSVLNLILAHLFRLTYFWGTWRLQNKILESNSTLPPLKLDIIGQSVMMLGIQLMLLHAMVIGRRKKQKREMVDYEKSSSKHASILCKLDSFWEWDSFREHLEFLAMVQFACLASCHFLMIRYASTGVMVFGQISIVLESCLAIPQIRQNFVNKTTNGLSFMMILGWVLGDFMKFVYFFYSSSGETNNNSGGQQMFTLGCICAMCLDFVVLLQMIYWFPGREVTHKKEILRSGWNAIVDKIHHFSTEMNNDENKNKSLRSESQCVDY